MPRLPPSRPRRVHPRGLWRHSRGATAVEYGLIVAMIALSAVAGMSALGSPISGMFASLANNITAAR